MIQIIILFILLYLAIDAILDIIVELKHYNKVYKSFLNIIFIALCLTYIIWYCN